MKAILNGVSVEGTPEEVWALLQKANAQGTQLKPYKPFDADWIKNLPKVVSTEAIKRCEGTCYCTGACERSFQVRNNGYFDYPVFNNAKV